MVEYKESGEISLTVAGLNKKTAVPYLKQKYGDKIFDSFTNKLQIPREYSGSNTHTYIDKEREGMITDYLGVKYHYKESTSVHIEQSEYNMKLSKEYVNYILQVQEGI